MLVFDLTPDLTASEGHISDPADGDIRIEMKFGKALPDPLVCLLYLEYDSAVLIDAMRQLPQTSNGYPSDNMYYQRRAVISRCLPV